MAYNFTLALLPATTLESISITSPTVLAFDDIIASGRPTLTGAQVGAHVVLLDLTFGDSAKDYARDRDRQVYVVSFSGVSSTYVLEAAGEIERLRVQIDGEVAIEHGDSLPVERELLKYESDEDAHVAVFESLLGRPLTHVFKAHFVELSLR